MSTPLTLAERLKAAASKAATKTAPAEEVVEEPRELTPLERLKAAKAKADAAKTASPLELVDVEEPEKELSALERLKMAKSKTPTTESENPFDNKTDSEEIGKVVTAANLVEAGNVVAQRAESSPVAAMVGISMAEVRQKIADLQTAEDGPQLKGQMDVLRSMLLSNPDACATMLPEDLGLMVRALRRMTSNRVAMDLGKAKPRSAKSKEAKLSAAEMATIAETGDWS